MFFFHSTAYACVCACPRLPQDNRTSPRASFTNSFRIIDKRASKMLRLHIERFLAWLLCSDGGLNGTWPRVPAESIGAAFQKAG